jgi:ACS family glucarate transporter-like MFS transporter
MNISIAAKFFVPEFGLTQIQIGQIFASFMLGYALFQLPAGILGDRWGPRRVLTMAAVWWGTTTLLTAIVPGIFARTAIGAFGGLIAIRFLLGVGEAATYPVATRAIANWIPPSGRGLTNAIVIAGATMGAATTPPLVSWLMVTYGWRASFYITGFIAFFLAVVWWLFSSDAPRVSAIAGVPAGASEGKADSLDRLPGNRLLGIPWAAILGKKDMWLLSISYMFDSYLLFIFIFWLYTYLTDVRGFSLLRGGLFASLPFVCGTIMTPIGGYLCDHFCIRFGALRGRRIAPVACLLFSGLFVFLGAKVSNPYIAIAVLSLSAGFIESTEGAYWATSADIGRNFSGAAGGMMNMFGNFGGVISTALVPILVKHFGWLVALGSGTVTATIAALLWFWVRTSRDPTGAASGS